MKIIFTFSLFLLFGFVFSQTESDYFITKWDLSQPGTSGNNSLVFPITTTGDVDYVWETIPSGTTGSGTISGTFAYINDLPVNAIIRLKIAPTNFNRFSFSGFNLPNEKRLIDIEQWGTVNWSTMQSAFEGCHNMNCSATDIPNLTNVTNVRYMFYECYSLNGPTNINSWNMSSVTNFYGMFAKATLFNQPIGNWNISNATITEAMFASAGSFNQSIENWNTSNVTDMSGMFSNTNSFNQPLNNWNTSNVTDFGSMFQEAISFNQSLNNWNTSSATTMQSMFYKAASFNGAIGNWNTSLVQNMSSMFLNALAFNQPIGNWNVGNVKYFNGAFLNAISFNQPIGNWNTSNVLTMSGMFQHATTFNQPIGNWNTSNVTNMNQVFLEAINFNQPIGNWNTSNVTNMSGMFYSASVFNQPIGNWDTSKVTDMSSMFGSATSFNQSLGTWILNSNVSMTSMLNNCGIDCNNYSDTLIGWSNNSSTPNNRNLGALNMKFNLIAQPNRTTLTNSTASGGKGWTITGDTSCENLGEENFTLEEQIEIYPNPTKNLITIASKNEIQFIEIYNQLSQKILSTSNSKNIDISSFSNGTYLIAIKFEEKIIYKKIIKN